jgi:fructose-1,6-bisphosphatase/inositol monophosphatase family enzyme
MEQPDLNRLLFIAAETAKDVFQQAEKDIKNIRRVKVDLPRDVKIEGDYKLEELIIKSLLAQSGYPVLSEEAGLVAGRETDGGYRWIIDPLDGSLNFSRGIPMCCISIGFWKELDPVLGVVFFF